MGIQTSIVPAHPGWYSIDMPGNDPDHVDLHEVVAWVITLIHMEGEQILPVIRGCEPVLANTIIRVARRAHTLLSPQGLVIHTEHSKQEEQWSSLDEYRAEMRKRFKRA